MKRTKFKRFSPAWWDAMTMPEPNTGCLLWMGCVCKSGYGRVAYGNGSPVLVHRIAYEQAFGPVGSRHICHRCDTPSCVNPDHLFVGSQKDNMQDMFAKGRGNPGGRKPRRLTLLRTLAADELASKKSDDSVIIGDPIHLLRSSAVLASWRHVTGVPAIPKDHDGPSCRVPRLSPVEPANRDGVGLGTGATVAERWLGGTR